jgi:ABC-type transport system involved in multi-copper enzyme maturation permease subunit
VIQPWIFRLLFAALALPILMCILLGLGYLLSALGDADGAAVVVRVNLAMAVLWVFDLILLIVTLAISAVAQTGEETAPPDESILVQTDDELKP